MDRSINLGNLSDREVISRYAEVMAELERRDIVRSGNNPIADIAERLIADYFHVELAAPNEKGFDLKACSGTRVQVKALRMTKPNRSTLSAIRSLGFEVLAVVVFEKNMRLREALLIPIEVVKDYKGYSKTWKADRLSLTNKLRVDSRVTTLTAQELLGSGPAAA